MGLRLAGFAPWSLTAPAPASSPASSPPPGLAALPPTPVLSAASSPLSVPSPLALPQPALRAPLPLALSPLALPPPAFSPPGSPGLFARHRRRCQVSASLVLPSPPGPGTRAPPSSPVLLGSLGRDNPRRSAVPAVEEYFRQLPQGGR